MNRIALFMPPTSSISEIRQANQHSAHLSAERGHPGRSVSPTREPRELASIPVVGSRCAQDGRAPFWLRVRQALTFAISCLLFLTTVPFAQSQEILPERRAT